MNRLTISLMAVFTLAAFWGPGPAGAESADYRRAQATYNQATNQVYQARDRLAQAQARLAQAQAAYNQADAQCRQTQAEIKALERRIDSLGRQFGQNSDRLTRLSQLSWIVGLIKFSWIEADRIVDENDRLLAAWFRDRAAMGRLYRILGSREESRGKADHALLVARNEVQAAKAQLDRSKQRQVAALWDLNHARDRGQGRVVQSGRFGTGMGDLPPWLRQIQQRWGQSNVPGSRPWCPPNR